MSGFRRDRGDSGRAATGIRYLNDIGTVPCLRLLNTMLNNVNFLATAASITGGASRVDLPTVGIRMAIAVIAVLPVLVVYPFFQKYLIKGIVVGGVKG